MNLKISSSSASLIAVSGKARFVLMAEALALILATLSINLPTSSSYLVPNLPKIIGDSTLNLEAKFALVDQVAENITSTSGGGSQGKLLSQAAPYETIEVNRREEPQNVSTTSDEQLSNNLAKLLNALNSNGSNSFEILSETMSNNNSNNEAPDFTFKNLLNKLNGSQVNATDELEANFLVLREILEEANQTSNWKSNSSSVLKDNHNFLVRSPQRSRPIITSPLALEQLMTVPPIRRTIDVVAENYTAKKIAVEANIFALKLFHELNVEKLGSKNLIQSPFAVYQGLALLLSGANGDTAKELDRVLLGSQSVYENTKLTHDQDRSRLLASLGDSISKLQWSATNHWVQCPNPFMLSGVFVGNGNYTAKLTKTNCDCPVPDGMAASGTNSQYNGGTTNQHLIVANNLLFSPAAYEISNEFKTVLASHYNNTALTKTEVGSTESIQVINSWIRSSTLGTIPSLFSKRQTFDEFNVMTMLSTAWLAQEWRDTFYRVSSSLRAGIRLKGQNAPVTSVAKSNQAWDQAYNGFNRDAEVLMEFVDDSKSSHFVEFIRSKPTKNIQHYHSVLNGQVVDIVVVPFRDSYQRLILLTPIAVQGNQIIKELILNSLQQDKPMNVTSQTDTGASPVNGASQSQQQMVQPPDHSPLTRLISNLANNPRRALKSLWNTVNPEIITKATQSNTQIPKLANGSETLLVSGIPPRVQLSIPILRLDADATISAALNHIGVVNTFDPSQANLIGINGHPFNYNKLHLSNVITKTTFNINEHGINYDRTIKTLESLRVNTERRSSSSSKGQKQQVVVDDKPDLKDVFQYELIDDVKLNKPFVYMIADFRTNLILYTGVLRVPTQTGV